eukprot:contig_15345_g3664
MPPLQCDASTRIGAVQLYDRVGGEGVALGALFFIVPLFTPSATEREVQAVESEFRNCLLNDGSRRCQVLRLAAAPGHPARKWGAGNAASLWDKPITVGVDVRAALLEYHGRHYRANRMTLVLVAPAPLDTLAAWAEALFGDIPNTHAPVAADAYAGLCPYGPAETGRRLLVVPIEEHRWLSLFWVVPPLASTYLTDPVGYIAHRFNYAGPGSLLSALRAHGWASSVSASSFENATHWQTVQVWVDLTRAGAAAPALDAVIESIFAYLRLLEKEGVTTRTYQDAADIARLSWTYCEREEPSPLAQKLARRMHFLPHEHLCTAESLYMKYDESLILDTLRLLTPAAAVIMVLEPAFKGTTDLMDEWYGTAYSMARIPDVTLTAWATTAPWPELAVGPPNAFIPTDLALVCDALDGAAADGGLSAKAAQTAVPTRVSGPSAVPEEASAPPLADCNGDAGATDVAVAGDPPSARSPHPEGASATSAAPPVWEPPLLLPVVSPADATCSEHPVVLRDDASLRLHYKLDRTFRRPKARVCINLVTPAVHMNARSLVLAILATRVLADDLTEETSDVADAGLSFSCSAVTDGLHLSLCGYTHKLPLLLGVVVERLARFRADPARFARVKEVLHRGYKNVLKRKPLNHARTTVSMLTYTPSWHLTDLLNYPVRQTVVSRIASPKPEDPNSAVVAVYQLGLDGDPVADVTLSLLAHMLSDRVFTVLRTEQQLGYAVSSWWQRFAGVNGLCVAVQSPSASPETVAARIQACLDD